METIVSVSAQCKNFPTNEGGYIKYFAALFQFSAYPSSAIMISPEMKFDFYETRLQTVHDSLSFIILLVLNSAKKSTKCKGPILVFPFKYNF